MPERMKVAYRNVWKFLNQQISVLYKKYCYGDDNNNTIHDDNDDNDDDDDNYGMMIKSHI